MNALSLTPPAPFPPISELKGKDEYKWEYVNERLLKEYSLAWDLF